MPAQVERVLSASVFQRPSVVLAVQVLGAGKCLHPEMCCVHTGLLVVCPNPWYRVRCLISRVLYPQGDALSKLDGSKAAHSATVEADASTLLRAVTAVVGSSEQSFVYKSLAPANLPATCGDRCKEKTAHVSVQPKSRQNQRDEKTTTSKTVLAVIFGRSCAERCYRTGLQLHGAGAAKLGL